MNDHDTRVLLYIAIMALVGVVFIMIGTVVIGEDAEEDLIYEQPAVLMQDIELSTELIALSSMLHAADLGHPPHPRANRCNEDELYWFTGDFSQGQWQRECVPLDRIVFN